MQSQKHSFQNRVSSGILGGWPAIMLLAAAVLFSSCSLSVSSAIERVGIIDLQFEDEDYSDSAEELRKERPLLWRNHMLGYFDHVEIVSDEIMEERGLAAYDLLILPEARVPRQQHQEEILRFVRQGKALILTGRSGEKPPASDGQPGLAEVLGLEYQTADIPSLGKSTSWWVIMDQPAYLSSRMPVLQHLAVEREKPVSVTGGEDAIAFWMSATVEADESFDDAAHRTAIAAGSHGDGRFLWLGFMIEGVGGDLETSQNFHRLLINAFDWFRGRATVEIEPWPYPYQQAAAFSMDTETAFGNIRNVAELENLSTMTYFLLTEPADLYVDLLRRIARNPGSEIATGEMAVHGDSHDVFRGQSREEQTARLQRTVDYIQEHIGARPLGFRPPEAAYDYTTLQSLADTGFKYMFADENPIRNTPAIVSVGNRRLVQLPMLNKDDIKIIIRQDEPSPEEVLDEYIKDIDQIFRREGVYLANFHTHVLAGSDYFGVLESMVDYALARGPWLASCLELARWWLRRDAVELTVVESQPGRLLFRVVNDGDETISDLGFSLWLPEGDEQARLEKQPLGERILDYRRESDRRLRFSLPELRPDDEQEFVVRW